MVSLQTRLRGVVGDATAKKFATAFGMETVEDLLRHYPRRYATLGQLSDLSELEVGQHVTVLAQVKDVKAYKYRVKGTGRQQTRTEVELTDGSGSITATFFSQPWRSNQLSPGTVGLFAGDIGEFRGKRQLTHPFLEPIEDDADPTGGTGRLARGLIAMYPASAKVPSFVLEKAMGIVLDTVDQLDDPIPSAIRKERDLPDLATALEWIHRPRSAQQWQSARARFQFEEALVLQTVFARRRHELDVEPATARPPVAGGLRELFADQLPYQLTDGQRHVLDEISTDLSGSHPMHRLLQGEVGSGKTVVSLLAMLQVIDAGGQAALLAPTEVLAAQHYRAIATMLAGSVQVHLLTGSLGARARRDALAAVESGDAGIVIGTHALLSDDVAVAELGLLVIDEQHRFGVEQRALLADRAAVRPHVLVMTATPIPRTVAMTVFGDLETSTLRELPAGRQPIQTNVVPADNSSWMARVWERVREEVGRGRQAYVVVSKIASSESEGDDRASVQALHDELAAGPLAGMRLATLHGRMAADVKNTTMSEFAAGRIDVLVATTVIEVGVDVPNATAMVIMDADRFGISQLHQLRGRVGRGSEAGLCLLVTGSSDDSPAGQRLAVVASTTDGFELSAADLRLRREGDVLGSRQSGVRSSLRLLSVQDEAVITEARDVAMALVHDDPTLSGHHVLAGAVKALEDTEQAEYLERT